MNPAADPLTRRPRVRRIMPADVERVTDTMARAFDEDPVVNYLVAQDRQRTRRVRRFMRLALVPLTLPYGETYVTDGFEGAAYWNPPNQRPHGPINDLRLLPALIRVAGMAGLPRAVASLNLMEHKHPEEPHYYLFAVGIEPEMQGRGVGTLLLAPVLDRCDRQRVPAYLESTNERNLPLYERHGFRVVEEVALPKGGPKLWRMWRGPQARDDLP